jgi:flagellar basal body-associated protein FliL
VATEKAPPDQAEGPPKARRRWLLAVVPAVVAIGAGSGAGALGYLAPVQELLTSLRGTPEPSLPVFYPLPVFRVPLGALSDFNISADGSPGRHLQAVIQLEVAPDRLGHVEALEPRIVDAIITFLRVLNERDVAWAYGLERLKAQILHRVREVTDEDAVQSVLVTEFVVL